MKGHRNPMKLSELEHRMKGWLGEKEYQAYLLLEEEDPIGYCLFKDYLEFIYIRHFFITDSHRRKGFGRLGLDLMKTKVWGPGCKLRMEVLVTNLAGIAFWRGCGFRDYCITMEYTNK